jgi:hypothetical protein
MLPHFIGHLAASPNETNRSHWKGRRVNKREGKRAPTAYRGSDFTSSGGLSVHNKVRVGRCLCTEPQPGNRLLEQDMEVSGQDGIQRLLAAEQEAQLIVTKARKGGSANPLSRSFPVPVPPRGARPAHCTFFLCVRSFTGGPGVAGQVLRTGDSCEPLQPKPRG